MKKMSSSPLALTRPPLLRRATSSGLLIEVTVKPLAPLSMSSLSPRPGSVFKDLEILEPAPIFVGSRAPGIVLNAPQAVKRALALTPSSPIGLPLPAVSVLPEHAAGFLTDYGTVKIEADTQAPSALVSPAWAYGIEEKYPMSQSVGEDDNVDVVDGDEPVSHPFTASAFSPYHGPAAAPNDHPDQEYIEIKSHDHDHCSAIIPKELQFDLTAFEAVDGPEQFDDALSQLNLPMGDTLDSVLAAEAAAAAAAAASAGAVASASDASPAPAVDSDMADSASEHAPVSEGARVQPKRRVSRSARSFAGRRIKNKSFECEHCGQVFNYQQSLSEHLSNVHQGIKERYSCRECGHAFPYRNQVYRHQRDTGHAGGAVRVMVDVSTSSSPNLTGFSSSPVPL